MSIKEIEDAVSTLDSKELSEFSSWFEEFLADQWDKKFESDVISGKLNSLARSANADFEAGRCSCL